MNLGHRTAMAERDRNHAAIVWLADELERWTTADDRALAVEMCDDDTIRDVLRDVLNLASTPAGCEHADGGSGYSPAGYLAGDDTQAHPAASAVPAVSPFDGPGPCASCDHQPACGYSSVTTKGETFWLCHDDGHSCYVPRAVSPFSHEVA